MCIDSVVTADNQPMSHMRIELMKRKWEELHERYQNYYRTVGVFFKKTIDPP
jgi:hypothetical protein